MRNTIKIIFLLIGFICKAQNADEAKIDTVYNNLYSRTPKNFKVDEISKPNNRFFTLDLNSIGGLRSVYQFQDDLKFNGTEINWLNKQIDQIALAFYLEGKPILIRKVGGYDGCPDVNVYTETIKRKKVTILNFCFTCSGAGKLDEFIQIFNNRTNSLLK
ncbi:hypothetical protein J2Y38_000101 [Flavobacterium sp. 2755]|uniref:hypothetical protein n=1 Tax=Flavobacterium sp. 2755 TaxID=2817765 RepID=UPI0028570500|nr:hypothetical protein [Flavobacterium sp. 2755]MDR6759922.1 hypothetical protein [Flavobacterium sp. 2755]